MVAAAMLLTTNLFAQNSVAPAGTSEAAPSADPLVEVEAPKLAKISFQESKYDFGKITQGDVVKHTFTLTNVGENPLKLESVKPSCGCTALDWPKNEIAPGGTAEIEAQFNSAGKMGRQQKYITIVYNGEPKIERIMFTGEIVPKPAPVDMSAPKVAPAVGHEDRSGKNH